MRAPGQQLLHVYLCSKLWRSPLASFRDVVEFASHLPPFFLSTVTSFVWPGFLFLTPLCKFLVSAHGLLEQESRGTFHGAPKNTAPLHIVKQRRPRHVQKQRCGQTPLHIAAHRAALRTGSASLRAEAFPQGLCSACFSHQLEHAACARQVAAAQA